MKLLNWLLCLLFSLQIISCQKSGIEDIVVAPITASNQLNVAYGTDTKQNMDIYLPANRTSATTKVMIMIHGGGWNEGDKADLTAYVDTLKALLPGYAIFNINYRLATQAGANLFPTQENDVKAATEFIYNKRNEFAISDRVVMLGVSAGAHLAMLQAYKYTSPVRVRAVVNFFGPSNIVDLYENPASVLVPPSAIARLFGGGTPSTAAEAYFQASPINFIAPQSAATITLQGGLDPLIRPQQQVALKAKLDASNITNQYVLYPTETHGWTGANLTNSFLRIQTFLNTNVQ